MALDINTQDLIIDESTGLTDDDVNPSTAPHSSNTTLAYLLSLDSAGGLAPPEVAFQANFVQATASAGETITSVTLAQNASGTPFSTTVGVNSGLRTADGDYVWLFRDPTRANVVIGVIGTSNPATEPAETGPLALSLALIGTSATNADLYTVQYLPLLHPDANAPDDRIDLTDKVFASVSGTTVVNFSQLGDAPPGHNNWYILDADVAGAEKILVTAHDAGTQAEVNVSTQGLGVASQDVRFGRELQIDIISGGTQSAGKNFTNTPIAPDYTAHVENVSRAGFSVSQSTPTNTKADIEIHAYNNNDNAEGAALPGDDNDTEINIIGATFKLNGAATTAAALGITVDLTGTGLVLRNVGEGVTVDFTTAGGLGGTFDRFTIKNIDGDKDYFDVKEVHYSSDVANAYAEEVGSFIDFDDDGPSIDPSAAAVPTLTVDETAFATNASASFAGLFTSGAFGSDGFKDTDGNNLEDADAISYQLGVSAPNVVSGLIDTLTNEAVTLSVNAARTVVTGSSATGGTVFTVTLNADTGAVTLDQLRAVVHDNPADPDESLSPAQLSAANLVTLTAKITDGDSDTDTAARDIGDAFKFEDDGPSIDPSAAAVPTLTVDETALAINASASFAGLFTSGAFGSDGFKDTDGNNLEDADAISYQLGVSAPNVASGLIDTLTNEAVTLSVNAARTVVTGSSATGGTVFTVTLNADTGAVTLDQLRAVMHDDPADPDESLSPAQLNAANLVTLTAKITDGDGDTDTAARDIGGAFKFEDDGPSITLPVDTDPAAGIQTTERLGNAVNQTAGGVFGYDLGADGHTSAFYLAGGSDFIDIVAGGAVQIGLTGTVDNAQNPGITSAVATLASESASSATFNWSFHYDKDPIVAGVQDAAAAGTLTFDKLNDTYSMTLTDPIDGFSFAVLHTNELLQKVPTSNTGHPEIVVTELDADSPGAPSDGFYVQFTANSVTNSIGFGFNETGDGSSVPGDTAFDNGQFVANDHEDWVSATRATNGVAGDTIQKGELLTLRFFGENVLGDAADNDPDTAGVQTVEKVSPTTTADGIAIKFDGIGNSEDLIVILDLIDANDNHTTRAINVQNTDLIKGSVPAPYSNEFSLDNNDALLVIEANDYNADGESYQIQGVQIMQSGNGLTGNAINLNGAIGTNGGSNATGNLTAWDTLDNDVLKIVDIGFIQRTSGTIDANLDFAFQLQDGDFDPTGTQHLLVSISNNWIV